VDEADGIWKEWKEYGWSMDGVDGGWMEGGWSGWNVDGVDGMWMECGWSVDGADGVWMDAFRAHFCYALTTLFLDFRLTF
jgi:hypothetical protein